MAAPARTLTQLGAVLRRRRKALKLSQAELGARTNLRQATISTLEAGETDTRLGTVLDVLAALDLEILVQPRAKTPSAMPGHLF